MNIHKHDLKLARVILKEFIGAEWQEISIPEIVDIFFPEREGGLNRKNRLLIRSDLEASKADPGFLRIFFELPESLMLNGIMPGKVEGLLDKSIRAIARKVGEPYSLCLKSVTDEKVIKAEYGTEFRLEGNINGVIEATLFSASITIIAPRLMLAREEIQREILCIDRTVFPFDINHSRYASNFSASIRLGDVSPQKPEKYNNFSWISEENFIRR